MNTRARPFPDADYLALKAAFRRSCKEAGPLHSIAEHTRVDPALLSRYGNANESTFPPVDVALDLDALAGNDRMLTAWAELRGYELVPRQPSESDASRLADHTHPVLKETSDVTVRLAATSTRQDCPRVAQEIETEVSEAIDALQNVVRHTRSIRAARAG